MKKKSVNKKRIVILVLLSLTLALSYIAWKELYLLDREQYTEEILRAESLIDEKKYDQAESVLTSLKWRGPKSYRVYAGFADINARQGNAEEAKNYSVKSLRLYPDSPSYDKRTDIFLRMEAYKKGFNLYDMDKENEYEIDDERLKSENFQG